MSTVVKRLSSSNYLECDLERNLKILLRIQRAHGSTHIFTVRLRKSRPLWTISKCRVNKDVYTDASINIWEA